MPSGRTATAIVCALAALVAVLAPGSASAASPEARVKSAYLYKLASFVRWPDDSRRSEFRLCVAGNTEMTLALRSVVSGERVLGLPVTVASLDARTPAQARNCQVVYVGRGREAARAIMAAVDGLPVLTVGDRNAGSDGGVIDFVVRDGKVRFMIDRGLARKQRLELSSKLLDIALSVNG
jgi:hypothetical protein